ncbi:thrombopoietin isoform X1 [Clupea harengus]|uniref:Thrombopoietin isoform X1 n=1 Tax=Clupea harengus TaxID=7950 RepID=A0A8M1K9V4_CLUHA|nr:thrombopoietin isoform X1 [Clupea harengus]
MAVTRFLLPSLFLIASTACDSRTSDFLCISKASRAMNKVKNDLRGEMVNCTDLRPSLIRLSHTMWDKATWEKIQFQDRMAEILQSLSNLVQDVKAARGLTQSGCGSILEILEKNAINYQVILTHPSITVMVEQLRPREATSPPIIQKYPSKETGDLKEVLNYFRQLLRILGWLIIELNVNCGTGNKQ